MALGSAYCALATRFPWTTQGQLGCAFELKRAVIGNVNLFVRVIDEEVAGANAWAFVLQHAPGLSNPAARFNANRLGLRSEGREEADLDLTRVNGLVLPDSATNSCAGPAADN